MKLQRVKGSTSVILTVFIQDNSKTTGEGLGGLDQTKSIVGGYVREGATGVALAVDENVTTEGTYQAPSAASKVRIGTPANMRTGTYELHFHNDLFASGADTVTITLGGATNMADLTLEIQLTTLDMNTVMRGTDDALLAASINLTAGVVDEVTLVGTTIANTDMVGTDGALTDKDGFSLASTGLDLILSTSTAFVAIAKAIWDRVITGANHNIVNSAGRIVRGLRDAGSYSNGLVWLDANRGTAGSSSFENGTEVKPVTLIADANTLLAASDLGLHGVHVAAGTSVTFPGAQDDEEWTGEGWTLVLNGKSIAGTTIIDAIVSGISIGVPNALRECFINGSTFAGGDFVRCAIGGILKLSGATVYHFFDCHHARAAALSEIDFDAAVGSQEVHLHHWHGSLLIKNMKAGDVLHFTCSDGALTLDSTCTAGTVNRAGIHGFTNNGSGQTINDIGVGSLSAVTDAILADTTIPTKNVAFPNIPVLMVDSTDHVTPKTGLTVIVQRSLDGGAYANATGSIAEIGVTGDYSFDASQADMNGDKCRFKFSATGADNSYITLVTR